MLVPFATGTKVGNSLAVDTQASTNAYFETSDGGKTLVALYVRPGLEMNMDFGGTPVRGFRVIGDSIVGYTLFVVHFNQLVEVAEDGTRTQRGTLNSTENPCWLSWNGRHLLVTDGIDGYVWDAELSAFTVLNLATHGWDVQSPSWCTFLAQQFIVKGGPRGGRYYISNPGTGLQWDAAVFGIPETDPDGISMLTASHGELWLFGPKTTEIHYATGDNAAPFAPKLGATLEWGTIAPFSVTDFDNTLAFIAQSTRGGVRVMRMNGYTPTRISNDGIEKIFSGFGTVADAIGIGYDFDGHAFYTLTFPSEDVSWTYDAATNEWFETPTNGGRYLGQWSQGLRAGTLITSYLDGKIYQVANTQTDGNFPIRVVVTGKTLSEREQWLDHDSLQIVFEHGTAPGSRSAQAMLRWSDDNAFTWSNEYWRPLGRIGRYKTRARWNRLGRARNRTYQVAISEPFSRVIVGMALNVR